MAKNSKDFLVSTADVVFIHNGMLAFTGTTSLNTSIAVSMEDQEITGGKGNKVLYKYKYGRKVEPSIEMAEWNLAYIAANVGTPIFEGLKDVYASAECVVLTAGVGTLAKTPIGDVFVEKSDGTSLKVTPVGNVITVGTEDDTVRATYQYNTNVKRVTIDAESTPLVGELILTADKHNNLKGKVGEVQIDVPSFQLSGTFDISLESSGSTTTKLDGSALAVEGASCSDGSVYAYITEIPSEESSIAVADIAATPSVMRLVAGETKPISVIGIKNGLYSNIVIDPADCIMETADSSVATVDNGIVTAIGAGETTVSVEYGTTNIVEDFVKVIVTGGTVTKKPIGSSILTIPAQSTELLGKKVSEMIEPGAVVYEDGEVNATLKKITGFTEFSSVKAEQSGYYFPFTLSGTGTKMSIIKNGNVTKKDLAYDKEILLKVTNSDKFAIEVDGVKVVELNFANATLN